MFRDSRLFRLILDELEKTLVLVDLSIARDYADLVADETARRIVFSMVEREYQLTRDMVLRISGDEEVAQRFAQYRARLDQRLPTINEVNREQVELLRRFRSAEDELTKEQYKSALLVSINCIAAGLGATG
jgi:phosphoenolpyruvate carboxylase